MQRGYVAGSRSPTVVRLPRRCSNACMAMVLIADDHAGMRALLEATLADDSWLEIVEVWDGIEALARARRYLPLVMLLDLDLPGLERL